MELWIRNQNKQKLVKVNGVGYVSEGTIWAFDTDNLPFAYLGVYPNKKRCIEIIDEIQKILSGTGFIFLRYPHIDEEVREYLKPLKPVFCEDLDCGCKVEQLNSYVYEMPQE